MSGATITEYAAHVAAAPTASTSPVTSPETPPPDPAATSATPPNETRLASQKMRERRSSPAALAISAAKIGGEPRLSATGVAVVSLTAYRYVIWFTQTPMPDATSRSGRSGPQ